MILKLQDPLETPAGSGRRVRLKDGDREHTLRVCCTRCCWSSARHSRKVWSRTEFAFSRRFPKGNQLDRCQYDQRITQNFPGRKQQKQARLGQISWSFSSEPHAEEPQRTPTIDRRLIKTAPADSCTAPGETRHHQKNNGKFIFQ